MSRMANLIAIGLLVVGCEQAAHPAVDSTRAAIQPRAGAGLSRADSTSSALSIKGPAFTLDIPPGAEGHWQVSDAAYWVSGLPYCGGACGLSVRYRPNRGLRSLASFVAAVQAQDSTQNDQDMTQYAYGRATTIRLAGADGLMLRGNCGDCISASIFVARDSSVAEIQWYIDDQAHNYAALADSLTALAKTFRWREPAEK